MKPIEIVEVDLNDRKNHSAILHLVSMYALDPMGGGQPLSSFTKEHLIKGLVSHPTTVVFLAFHDETPVGVAICFIGFSTFAAKPLINIHDLAVDPNYRTRGIGTSILAAVENKARAMGCCKLTLEVLENNQVAKKAYAAFGFNQGKYLEETGGMLFYAKPLI